MTSSRIANCPSCGAQVEFKAGASIVSVCQFCSTAVARVGDDIGELEILGKVAPLAALGSPLYRGLRGKTKGRAFVLIGRLQLDYGAGAWNEWYAAFDDGDWGWVAEAQGQVYLTFSRPIPSSSPPFAEWRVGTRFTMANATLVAVERRSAKIVSAQGELPVRITPGTTVRYVDVEGPSGMFGTVDFGTGESVEAIYLGRRLEYEELFDKSDLRAADTKEAAAHVLDLKCPHCGAAVKLMEPDEAQRVTCAQCDALLDVQKGSPLFLVNAASKKGPQPHFPLGTKGKYKGQTWTVFAHLVRAVVVEGVRYAWDEYLVRGAPGWRWLLCQNGHWSWIEPASAADVTPRWGKAVEFRGKRFKHFQTSSPAVEHIRGELYWKVAVGERVRATDYVAPPLMLSEEVGAEETTWSVGTYLQVAEVQQIFSLPKPPTKPTGVSLNQPDPRGPRRSAVTKMAAISSAALVALGMWVSATSSGRVVYEDRRPLNDEVVLSDRFTLDERANLEVQVDADVDNSWMYLAGALIEESTDQVGAFGVEISYYRGVDGGESWSEGSTKDTVYLGEMPRGDYVLRFEPQWEKGVTPFPGRPPTQYHVVVRSDVFLPSHWFFALFVIWFYPLWLVFRRGTFEAKRWQESDHAS